MASAWLASPMTAYQSVTGSWLAISVEVRSARSLMTSVRSRRLRPRRAARGRRGDADPRRREHGGPPDARGTSPADPSPGGLLRRRTGRQHVVRRVRHRRHHRHHAHPGRVRGRRRDGPDRDRDHAAGTHLNSATSHYSSARAGPRQVSTLPLPMIRRTATSRPEFVGVENGSMQATPTSAARSPGGNTSGGIGGINASYMITTSPRPHRHDDHIAWVGAERSFGPPDQTVPYILLGSIGVGYHTVRPRLQPLVAVRPPGGRRRPPLLERRPDLVRRPRGTVRSTSRSGAGCSEGSYAQRTG